MNRHLKEALNRQTIRQRLKKEIRQAKSSPLNEEYESGLYKAFVEPFTDVLKAANLGAQDMLNSFVLHLRTFITFDPKKIEELHRGHDERQAKIAEKWKPLMEKTDAALSTGDADVLALAFAPGVFAVSAIGSTVANYSGDIGTFLDASGLGGFTGGLVPGSSSQKSSSSSDDGGILGGDLLDNLTKLFFVGVAGSAVALGLRDGKKQKESLEKRGPILSESPQEDFEKDFSNFLDVTGVEESLQQDGEKIFESLKETVKEMKAELTSRQTLVNEIDNAASLAEFISAFESAYSSDQAPKSNAPDTEKIKNELKASVDKLVSNSEFIAKTKEELQKDDVSDADLRASAEKTVFLDSKKQFQEGTQKENQSVEDLKKDLVIRIKEMMPTDAGLKILKKSKDAGAKEVVEFVESTKQFFGI